MDAIAKMPTYEAYKDSGVEWLGEVPSHWKSYPLCAKSNLKSVSNNENEELLSVYLDRGVIKFDEVDAKRTNVTSLDLSKYQLVEPGDFVLNNQQAWRGSVGISKYRGIVSPAYLILSISQDISPEFGNYLFRDGAMVANYLVCSKGVGTIQRNLYWPQLKRTLLFYPSLEEQTLIANFLDQKTAQIDEAIAIKEQQIALLKERKQIIIQKAVTQGLDPDVPMKDSGVDWIGEIPAHWEVVALAYALNAVGDVDHYMPETIDTGVPYFMTGDLEDLVSQMSFDDCKKVSYRDYNKLTKKIKTEVGDVILARYATIGTVTYVDVSEEFLVSYSCVTIKTDKKFLNGMYLFYFLKSDTFAQAVSKVVNTNTQGNVGIGDLKKIKIALPPLREQERLVRSIAKRLSEIDVVIEAQVNQITKLKEYKTTLINSAVTGKIRITPEMVA